MPAPMPYIVSLKPRSAFICSFAKPTFERSSHEMMYSSSRKGSSRHVTFDIVRRSRSVMTFDNVFSLLAGTVSWPATHFGGEAHERSGRVDRRGPQRGIQARAAARGEARRAHGRGVVPGRQVRRHLQH